MIFFTSDLHFDHEKIIKLCNRPFLTTEDMNTKLINNWNNAVSPDDTIYILGDFCVSSANRIEFFLNQLNGKKMLLKGNHDENLDKVFKNCKNINNSFFLGVYQEIVINDIDLVLFHYPIIAWKNYNKEAIHLHGHLHSLNPVGEHLKRYDVGIDGNNFLPVSINVILEKLSNNLNDISIFIN
ncbi:MAG: metallophosphoesterase [Mobilitalea sp.]